MFMLYLDGSGTSSLDDVHNHRHYVLLGVAVHEGNWFALERRVNELKQRYALPGVPLELHAAEICSTISEQDAVPDFAQLDWPTRRASVLAVRQHKAATRSSGRKRHHMSDGCLHLTRLERSRLYEECLDLIGSHDEIRLFAEIVNKQHLFKMTGKRDAIGQAFQGVVSRFDTMLRVFDTTSAGRVNNGLLVADVDQNSELMRDMTALFRVRGYAWAKLGYVIDTPFFVDSKSVSGIQLADIAAYAVRRYIDHGLRAGSPEERNFLRIYHRFDRGRDKLHGLRHYSERRSCPCIVCREMGRAATDPDVPGEPA